MSDNAIVKREETPLRELEQMAKHLVNSKLFGVQSESQAVALMLISQAEGLHPALASRDYHIIQGRHTLKADAMLARFQQSGGKIEWQDYTDTLVSAYFSHPQSPSRILVDWDINRAKQAGLSGRDNWKKYPRQMLKSRVVSDGVRLCFPGACVGVYTPEEAQDFDPIDVTPKKELTEINNTEQRQKPESTGEIVPAKSGQITIIRKQLEKKGLDDTYITEQMDLSKLENLPSHKVNEALQLISDYGAPDA